MKTALAFLLMGIFLTGAAWANDRRPPGPPPPEAIEACQDKAKGDACSFDGRRGAVEGTCQLPPQSESLACKPEGHPPRRQQ